jgi:hypothetical protein
VRQGHFEEAALLREWELDLKQELVAPASDASPIALVDTADIESVCPNPPLMPQLLAAKPQVVIVRAKSTLLGRDALCFAATEVMQYSAVQLFVIPPIETWYSSFHHFLLFRFHQSDSWSVSYRQFKSVPSLSVDPTSPCLPLAHYLLLA